MATLSKAIFPITFFLAIFTTVHCAWAGTEDLTSPTAFAAATSNPTIIGFNGILPAGVPFESFNSLTRSGVTFSTPFPGVTVNINTASYYTSQYGYPSYPADYIVNSENPTNNELVISFSVPTHALAFNYGGLGFRGLGSATITLSNGHVFEQPTLPTAGNTAFIGFVSTDPITSLTLSTTNDDWVVENLILASVPSSPIESTIAINFGSAGSSTNPTALVAEPVNTATGSYFSTSVDLAVRGRGLNFQLLRSYNSLDKYLGPLGRGWTHSYNIILLNDSSSGIVTIKRADGSTMKFSSDSVGNFLPAIPGLYEALRRNGDGSYTLTRKDQVRFDFSAEGMLTSIADRNGNSQVLTYSGGNLASVTDAAGRLFLFSYDQTNRLTSVTDPAGRKVHYAYDSSGNLISFTNAMGGTTSYTYDETNRLTTGTDPRGVIYVKNSYDSEGRVVSQSDGRQSTTIFAYDTPSVGTTTVTDPLGNSTQYIYDANPRLQQVIDAGNGATSYIYDANNNKTAITNANGAMTHFTFDRNGNITSITNPLGESASFTYDEMNNPLTLTNPAGAVTTLTYDTNGNLISSQDALGNKTTFARDMFGEIVGRTNPLGRTIKLRYDKFGNLTNIVKPLGNTTSFGYDAISRMTSITDGNRKTSRVTYDALGRRSSTSDALGNKTQYKYDPVGNLIKIIDAKGSETNFQYDNVDNLVRVVDALGNSTSYGYDEDDNRVSFTNANGKTTNYTYDSLRRRTSVSDPMGFSSSFYYDSIGNVVSLIDAIGNNDAFEYDAVNRPLSRTYADGNVITYFYDVNGRRVSIVDPHGVTNYGHDVLGRITTVKSPDGSVVRYSYDADGHRSMVTYPDGKIVTYTYDSDDRLSRVIDWNNRKTEYSYDAVGNRITVVLGNGARSTFGYDDANRLLNIVNRSRFGELTSFRYTLDELGNRTAVTDIAGGTTRYHYDAVNRLTDWIAPSWLPISYLYDSVGNRTAMSNPWKTFLYTYDADDRLLTAGTTSYTYDNNGNRLTKTLSENRHEKNGQLCNDEDDYWQLMIGNLGNCQNESFDDARHGDRSESTTTSYAFDALNRLTDVSGPESYVHYEYDGDGNRIAQQDGRFSHSYTVDVARRLPVVLNEIEGNDSVNFQYGVTLLSSSSRNRERFYQADGIGSTVDVTNVFGLLTNGYVYDPWGKVLTPEESRESRVEFKFAGEALDQQTGLYYLRARYYDPSVGRFISKDPFPGLSFVPTTENRYAYVGNNPLRFVDRRGLAIESITTGDLSLQSGAIFRNLSSSPESFAPPSPGPGMPLPGIPGQRGPSGPVAIGGAGVCGSSSFSFDGCNPGGAPPGGYGPVNISSGILSGYLSDPIFTDSSPIIPWDSSPVIPWDSSLVPWESSPFINWENPTSVDSFSNDSTCDVFDVCNAADTQAPTSASDISGWNNTSDWP